MPVSNIVGYRIDHEDIFDYRYRTELDIYIYIRSERKLSMFVVLSNIVGYRTDYEDTIFYRYRI